MILKDQVTLNNDETKADMLMLCNAMESRVLLILKANPFPR